ncbi:Uncharacterised protein [Lederbergia lenta]|uniref:Uncharacterized protein n=1 Tax=Lederbergia lenta TaxID=1467 RepID=A0A2X4VV28_LEDLE|nr:Uncharacterised protein [Lederbergia lenta]
MVWKSEIKKVKYMQMQNPQNKFSAGFLSQSKIKFSTLLLASSY